MMLRDSDRMQILIESSKRKERYVPEPGFAGYFKRVYPGMLSKPRDKIFEGQGVPGNHLKFHECVKFFRWPGRKPRLMTSGKGSLEW
jgi:hypothetical protein